MVKTPRKRMVAELNLNRLWKKKMSHVLTKSSNTSLRRRFRFLIGQKLKMRRNARQMAKLDTWIFWIGTLLRILCSMPGHQFLKTSARGELFVVGYCFCHGNEIWTRYAHVHDKHEIGSLKRWRTTVPTYRKFVQLSVQNTFWTIRSFLI